MLLDKKIEITQCEVSGHKLPSLTKSVNELVSDKLLTEIRLMGVSNKSCPDYIICGSISILSIVDSHMFSYYGDVHKNIASSLIHQKLSHQGKLSGFDVYLDFYLDPRTVLIKYSKKNQREYKLGVILDDDDSSKFIDTMSIEFVGLT